MTEHEQMWSIEFIERYAKNAGDTHEAHDFSCETLVKIALSDMCRAWQADRDAYKREQDEIEQAIGAVLGYPRYCDDPANFPDASEADGVCVGEHTAVTQVTEMVAKLDAANARIAELEAELSRLRESLKASEGRRDELRQLVYGLRAELAECQQWEDAKNFHLQTNLNLKNGKRKIVDLQIVGQTITMRDSDDNAISIYAPGVRIQRRKESEANDGESA